MDLSAPFVVDSDNEAGETCDRFIVPLLILEFRSPPDEDFVAAAVIRCCIRRCANKSLVSAGGRGCGGGNISWHAFNFAAMICVRVARKKYIEINVLLFA